MQATGQTTVYRALHIYADTGRIDTGRSHYLVCRVCGLSVPIDATVAQDWAADTAADNRFTDIHPVIELTGRCTACATS
jgi:Fur family ferric uptake transcriptional regulator